MGEGGGGGEIPHRSPPLGLRSEDVGSYLFGVVPEIVVAPRAHMEVQLRGQQGRARIEVCLYGANGRAFICRVAHYWAGADITILSNADIIWVRHDIIWVRHDISSPRDRGDGSHSYLIQFRHVSQPCSGGAIHLAQHATSATRHVSNIGSASVQRGLPRTRVRPFVVFTCPDIPRICVISAMDCAARLIQQRRSRWRSVGPG